VRCTRETAVTVAITAAVTCLGTNVVRDFTDRYRTDPVHQKVDAVDQLLDQYYLYDIDKNNLADYAALGMSAAANDPYTTYYSTEEFSAYMTGNEGDFIGTGIVVSVTKDTDEIVVVSPYEGSPGEAAGIQPGDIITAIDGNKYAGSQMNEAVAKIRGDGMENVEGTTVVLTIMRDNGAPFDVQVERKRIHVDSVKGEMLDQETGYVRITAFQRKNAKNGADVKDTYEQFQAQIVNLQSQGMKKMVIDLRDNPGGDLDIVSEIADMLLPEGTITYTEDKNGKRETITSDANELGMPMTLLVNGNSASASEVLTGALKDYQRATVIGTKTFGKGIVQVVLPLSDGSGMTITMAKYYSPNGVCIHGIGIEPDITVQMPQELEKTPVSQVPREKDVQLQRAIEVLKEK
jgi:carboxyl-terminal processing protease